MNNKFKEGDIVYIRKDIETVCRNRDNKGMFTDTIHEMHVFAGHKCKITGACSKTRNGYIGGAYRLYDISQSRYTGYIWYDFHLIPAHECIDVNEVVK